MSISVGGLSDDDEALQMRLQRASFGRSLVVGFWLAVVERKERRGVVWREIESDEKEERGVAVVAVAVAMDDDELLLLCSLESD